MKKVTMKELFEKEGVNLAGIFQNIPGVGDVHITSGGAGHHVSFKFQGIRYSIGCHADGCPNLDSLDFDRLRNNSRTRQQQELDNFVLREIEKAFRRACLYM